MRIPSLFFSLVLLGVSYTPEVWAQCRVPSTSSSLGTASSIALDGNLQPSQASTGFNCDAPTLSIAGTNRVIATFGASNNATSGLRRLKHATKNDYLPYTLCTDQACNNTLGIAGSHTWSNSTLLGLLGLFTGPNATLPLWIKTSAGATLSAGTYTDVIAVNWDYSVCDVGIGNLCLTYSGKPSSNITLTLTVTNDCQISTVNNVMFASAAFPSAFAPINSSLGVLCTKDGAYSVALTSTHPDDANWRRMTADVSGTNYYLQYQLYRADNSAWTESNSYAGTGTGATQTIPFTARINANQANKPAGSYKDTVSVAVTIN